MDEEGCVRGSSTVCSLNSTKKFQDDQVVGIEVGGACSAHGGSEESLQNFSYGS